MIKPVVFFSGVLLSILITNPNNCQADVNSGCPYWGCLPWGSFSLSSGIPSPNSTVAWRVHLETVVSSTNDENESSVSRGCVSDQESVVCTTHTGYFSIDPTTGNRSWSYSTMSSPYLPVLDVYGDVIGMDSDAMYYVGADGNPKHPIGLGLFKPAYSMMISNNSLLFITGSTNQTAQILTYESNGVVDASMELRDSIGNITGVFVPCSQPIIAGLRAYVMTYFVPDNSKKGEAQRVTGRLRLYAIDALQSNPRLVNIWHFDFESMRRQFIKKPTHPFTTKQGWQYRGQIHGNVLDPIVTYFDGIVYVNVPGNLNDPSSRHQRYHEKQPYPGTLWAIRDNGDKGAPQFKASSFYGPMAVYDTYDHPLSKSNMKVRPDSEAINDKEKRDDEEHLIWVVNRSPGMIQGYNARSGKIKMISGFGEIFEKLGWITSSVSITRSAASPNKDQLVFGTSDSLGRALISVVEIAGDQAKLVLSKIVSKPDTSIKTDNSQTTAVVEGQIVNFAFSSPGTRKSGGGKRDDDYDNDDNDDIATNGDTNWTLGLSAVVTETNSTSTSREVVGIF